MKIVVTGAGGQLGVDLVRFLSERGLEPIVFKRVDLDIGDYECIEQKLSNHSPHVIINCAAFTKVDDAECMREEAFRVNVIGSENLANFCRRINCILVHFSTDYIFNGKKKRPYRTDDLPHPLNFYGFSKWMGEERIRKIYGKHYIIRTSWLYGIHGDNFLKRIYDRYRSGEALMVVNDQFGLPTYTQTVCNATWNLINIRAPFGIYHISDQGDPASWYDFSKEFFRMMGIECNIKAISIRDLRLRAKRPSYSVLDSSLYEEVCGVKLPHWRESLREFVSIFKGGAK